MKKTLFFLLLTASAIFTSCQNELFIEENNSIPLSRAAESTTFICYDSYIYWDDNKYMLDYSLLGLYGNPPLDSDIIVPYIVTTNTGYTQTFDFTIPAGSTNVSIEGSTLGEAIITSMGLNRYSHSVASITILPYSYSGNMTIVGLDNLNKSPDEVYPQPPVDNSVLPISAEWTKGSYNIGEELKAINYFNVEGGIGKSYTLISKGYLVMEVALTNTTNSGLTYLAQDFAIQHYEWNVAPFSKQTFMYLTNSSTAQAISSISLPGGSTKTVYFHTADLFYEGNGIFDYNTTPPYHIQLAYKDETICGDDINVEYRNSYTEGWY